MTKKDIQSICRVLFVVGMTGTFLSISPDLKADDSMTVPADQVHVVLDHAKHFYDDNFIRVSVGDKTVATFDCGTMDPDPIQSQYIDPINRTLLQNAGKSVKIDTNLVNKIANLHTVESLNQIPQIISSTSSDKEQIAVLKSQLNQCQAKIDNLNQFLQSKDASVGSVGRLATKMEEIVGRVPDTSKSQVKARGAN